MFIAAFERPVRSPTLEKVEMDRIGGWFPDSEEVKESMWESS